MKDCVLICIVFLAIQCSANKYLLFERHVQRNDGCSSPLANTYVIENGKCAPDLYNGSIKYTCDNKFTTICEFRAKDCVGSSRCLNLSPTECGNGGFGYPYTSNVLSKCGDTVPKPTRGGFHHRTFRSVGPNKCGAEIGMIVNNGEFCYYMETQPSLKMFCENGILKIVSYHDRMCRDRIQGADQIVPQNVCVENLDAVGYEPNGIFKCVENQ